MKNYISKDPYCPIKPSWRFDFWPNHYKLTFMDERIDGAVHFFNIRRSI